MKRLSAALLTLIVAIAIVGCAGVVSGKSAAAPQTLQVATSTVPGGHVQASYSATLAATGGTQHYSWSVVTGSLPPGLALASSTGVIAGMPSASGQYSFTAQVTDPGSFPQNATQALTMSIAAAGTSPLQITTSSFPGGQVQTSYSTTLAATGGTQPYSWSVVTGSLPPGLALGTSTGVVTGTPTASGQYSFTVQVTDPGSSPQSATQAFTISIAAAGTSPLQITTSSLPGGQVQTSYGTTLAATGGTQPYSWSVVTGSLPPGLALAASTGVVTGTPTASGQYSFTVQVTDLGSSPQSARQAFTISIAAAGTSPLQITTSSFPGGQVQTSYSTTLAATGGTQPYSWSVVTGSLPSGLALAASTGVVTGTPTASGQYSFTVQVTDLGSSPQSATQAFTISIAAAGPSPLQITTSSLPGGQVQASYSTTLAATGATQPYSWSVVTGSLPPGLALNASTGTIAGTPTASGTFSFTVRVTDSSTPTAQTATASLSATLFTPAAGGVFCGATIGVVQLPNCDPSNPTANTVFDTTMPNTSAYTVVTVNGGGDLQTAINNASCSPNGTIISVAAGSIFNSGFGRSGGGTGPYILPNKTCAAGQWIIIESSALASLPASGTRVDPTVAANMPKLQSVGGLEVINVNKGANHYRFIGIEINSPANTDTVVQVNLNPYFNGSQSGATDHIIFDRCYIHGNTSELTHEYRRGIYASAVQFFAAIDSYISGFHSNSGGSSSDTQAISMDSANSFSFKIVNNYLSSSGENIISGGSPNGGNGQPADFEIRHNHFYKPANLWRNTTPTIIVKNLFELKNAVRVLMDGNVFDTTWAQAQHFALVWSVSCGDSGPGCAIHDVTFTHNIIKHAPTAMVIDNNGGSPNIANMRFQNNIYQDINDTTWGDGTAGNFLFVSEMGNSNVTIDHNTAYETGPFGAVDFDCSGSTTSSINNFAFTNNIVSHSAQGVFDTGCGHSEGSSSINFYTPSSGGSLWSSNVLINATSLASIYPAGSFLWATPNSTAVGFTDNTNCVGGTFSVSACQLLSTSPYHIAGTDSKDIGADIDSINSATAGVVQVHD